MTTKEAFQKILDAGFATATFAKSINRDASTLYKWVKGTRELSSEVENEVANKIKEMKKIFDEIDI